MSGVREEVQQVEAESGAPPLSALQPVLLQELLQPEEEALEGADEHPHRLRFLRLLSCAFLPGGGLQPDGEEVDGDPAIPGDEDGPVRGRHPHFTGGNEDVVSSDRGLRGQTQATEEGEGGLGARAREPADKVAETAETGSGGPQRGPGDEGGGQTGVEGGECAQEQAG